jgi:hypothetical protein
MADRRAPRKPSPSRAALWTCPRCGARLVTKNLSHSCGAHSIDKFLDGKTEAGRDLFARFAALIATCGPHSLAPAKTRVAFMAQVRFASVNRVSRDYIDVHFVLPEAIDNPRFRRVEHLGRLYVHHLRLRRRQEFDRELAAWLERSYAEYGQRRWLESKQPNGGG